MKRARFISLLLAMALLMAFASAALADTKAVKIVIPELCASTMTQITDVLEGLSGVNDIQLDVDNTSVVVKYSDGEISIDAIKRALDDNTTPAESVEHIQ